MWNEARSNAPDATSTIVPRAAGSVWQESPLVGVEDLLKANQLAASKKFRLRERPFLELVNLRGDPADTAFASALASVTGCRPPAKPNTVARGNGYDMLWLGPDEFLVRSQQQQGTTLEAKLREALETAADAAAILRIIRNPKTL